MTDEQRKLLTEYLGECWHIPTSYFTEENICAGDICRKCGKRGNFYDGDLDNRTFTAEADMMVLYRRMVEKGEWRDFISYIQNRDARPWDIGAFSEWISRLFCLSGEGYEERCQMVAERMRREK